jgi:hypothetical protein
MKSYFTLVLVIVVLPALSFLYYTLTVAEPVDRVFLSISTFLYSIFTGFFISRQASRFNKVRETVTRFDGLLSNIYRTSGHISAELQQEIGDVIKAHYEKIFATKQWNYHFEHKSVTISAIHELLEEHIDEKKVTKLSNQSIGAIVKGLGAAQDIRKSMLALNRERVPFDQWVLIVFFVAMLVGTVSTMESVGVLLPSVLKAAFVISVLSVMYILYRLNNLAFTEDLMGAESAQDVIDIIDGNK